ncbi:SDR family oxidoreductase [Streptomyces sp. NPDC005955]|uniref:SDR family NAD(P)-dependent oxidoreductase n=1 Tax=Streptomyces sp. NPDC005955 TaxID=3364738 RepID=UPI0036D17EBC
MTGAGAGTDRRRTALVTGAARGIGLAVAQRLLGGGWNVLLADVDPGVEGVARRLDPTGRQAVGLVVDVAQETGAERMAARAVEVFGAVDALVANAAVGGPDTPLLETSDEAVRRVFEINFFGVLRCARAVAPLLGRGGERGRIVVLGSLFAQVPTPGAGAYSASKAAVQSLMATLSVELAPVATVNSVAPGYIMTEMHREELAARARRSGRTPDQERQRVAAEVPLERHGTGDDVADAVHFLLSGAPYVTGQTINVNGGVLTS